MKTVRVTDLVYDAENSLVVKVKTRDEDGESDVRHIDGTNPYFFVPEGVNVPNHEEVRELDWGYESYDDQPLQKVITHTPDGVGELQDEFPEHQRYEDDVPFERRVSVDEGLVGYIEVPRMQGKRHHISEIETDVDSPTGGIEPKVMMCDIETEPPSDTDDFDQFAENAPNRVLMATMYDSLEEDYLALAVDPEARIDVVRLREELEDHWEGHDDEEKYTNCDMTFRRCDTEEELLSDFVNYVADRQPDLASGWNFVDFDWQYLMNRFKQFDEVNHHAMSDIGYVHGWQVEDMVDGLPAFDMLYAYCESMTFHDWRSESLEYVAGQQLDVGKMNDVSVGKGYENDRSRLMAYNIVDTQLLAGLDDQQHIHEFFYELADICGVQITDTQ